MRYRILGVAMAAFLWVGYAAVQPTVEAQSNCTTISENSEGRLRFCGNELLVESKVLDPSAIRLRAPVGQGGMGKISFDSGTTEKVLLIGAQSPGGGGEFSANLLVPGGGSNDADMRKAVYVNNEEGFRFLIPAHGLTSSIAGGGLLLVTQGDDNLVLYHNGVPIRALFGLPADKIW